MPFGMQQKEEKTNEVSVYSDEIVTKDNIKKQLERIKIAFPEITTNFIILLSERLIENSFTKKRLKDAVNYLIDHFGYKKPNIADIISFDRKVKLYTYSELLEINDKTKTAFLDYKRVLDGKYYVSVMDIEKYSIPIFICK